MEMQEYKQVEAEMPGYEEFFRQCVQGEVVFVIVESRVVRAEAAGWCYLQTVEVTIPGHAYWSGCVERYKIYTTESGKWFWWQIKREDLSILATGYGDVWHGKQYGEIYTDFVDAMLAAFAALEAYASRFGEVVYHEKE